jgi:HK97 family phage prohead protease
MELIRKDLDFDIRQVGAPSDRTLEFIGSTADVDRYGDVIEMDGWDLKNYKKNPVFLWAHDYKQPPIGKAVKVGKTDKGLLFQIKFAGPDEYAFAETIYKLYLGGYLRATSVGFQDLEREPITDKDGEQTGWRYKRQELYELSAVPVPANPQALIMAVQKGVVNPQEVEEIMGVPYEADLIQEAEMEAQEEQVKGVIPFKEYPTEPEDALWDGPAEVEAAEVQDLKAMCAWFDSENQDVKGSYKLPHHRAKGYRVVWRGVSAAMAALLGSRGGVNIPEADKKGVYNHLAKHYAQFEKEPPEFKEYGELNLRLIELGLFPVSEETAQAIESFYKGMERFRQAVSGALADFFKVGDEPAAKAGAVLSAKNKAALKTAQALIQQMLDSAEAQPSEEGMGPYGGHKPGQNIYSLALNPGQGPEGGRPAGESGFSQLLASTQKLHRLVKGGN